MSADGRRYRAAAEEAGLPEGHSHQFDEMFSHAEFTRLMYFCKGRGQKSYSQFFTGRKIIQQTDELILRFLARHDRIN